MKCQIIEIILNNPGTEGRGNSANKKQRMQELYRHHMQQKPELVTPLPDRRSSNPFSIEPLSLCETGEHSHSPKPQQPDICKLSQE